METDHTKLQAAAQTATALHLGAEAWARGADPAAKIREILAHEDHEAREGRLLAYVKFAWSCGALAVQEGLSLDEIEALAHPSSRAEMTRGRRQGH